MTSAPAWTGIVTSEVIPLVGVRGNVRDELDRSRPDRPAHHAVFQREAVANLRIAVLGDEPEAVVIDGIDACEQRAVERRTELRQILLDDLRAAAKFQRERSGSRRPHRREDSPV